MFTNRFTHQSVLSLAFAVGAAFSLYGCNDSSSSEEPPHTGVFIDAPVKGLQFTTPTQSGTTNDKGEFNYRAGETVTFSIDGLTIASVNGQAEIPVTILPHYLKIARFLQSIDIDPREAFINISGIKLPAPLKAQLQDLLSNGQGTFDAILTQTQLDNIESKSALQLANASPVSQSAAIQHITASISENLVEADFSKQTYVDINNTRILSFFADKSGSTYTLDENELSEAPFTWSVTNNTLEAVFQAETTLTSTLLSIDDNKYVFSSINNDETIDETDIDTFYKAKPISIAELDGKIVSLDMSSSNDCSSRTFKFTGNSVNVATVCTSLGGFIQFPRTVANIDSLDNGIQMNNGPFVDQVFLIEGGLEAGKGKIAIFGKQGDTIIEVSVVAFSIVDKEASL